METGNSHGIRKLPPKSHGKSRKTERILKSHGILIAPGLKILKHDKTTRKLPAAHFRPPFQLLIPTII